MQIQSSCLQLIWAMEVFIVSAQHHPQRRLSLLVDHIISFGHRVGIDTGVICFWSRACDYQKDNPETVQDSVLSFYNLLSLRWWFFLQCGFQREDENIAQSSI